MQKRTKSKWFCWAFVPYLNFGAWLHAAVRSGRNSYYWMAGFYSIPVSLATILGALEDSQHITKRTAEAYETVAAAFGALLWIVGLFHVLLSKRAIDQEIEEYENLLRSGSTTTSAASPRLPDPTPEPTPQPPAQSNGTDDSMNRKTTGWTLALLGAASIGIAYVDKDHFYWWFLPGIIPYIAFIVGFLNQCPKCGRWWASVEGRSELLDRWQETKDVEREDVTRDTTGKEIARTKRIEQVVVTCEKSRHYYTCKYCSAAWTEIKTHRNR